MKTPTLGDTSGPSKSRSHPPASPDRDQVLGGLVGVVAGERLAHAPEAVPRLGSASVAMVELAAAYTSPGTLGAHDVARRRAGVSGPAWLLPLAIVFPDPDEAGATAARLAVDADVAPKDQALWVAYVALASEITTPATPPGAATTLVLSGQAARDALTASRWALGQDRFNAVVSGLITSHAAPSAAAAALGLWGLTHGACVIPAGHRASLRRLLGPTVTSLMRSRTARSQPARSMLDDLLGVA